MQHEHTEHVAAPPEAVYAAISDAANLSRFVPQITSIRPAGDGRVEVDARYEGREQHGEASFNADDSQHRIDWSTPSGYHGWMKVDADDGGSRITLFLDTRHGSERDHDVAATLDAIRMLVESEVQRLSGYVAPPRLTTRDAVPDGGVFDPELDYRANYSRIWEGR